MRNLLTIVIALVLPMSAASVDGLKLHSATAGKGSKTVILVHGWTCDDTTWTSQVPVLSKDFRVITLDLPGHGKSGMPKQFSMDGFARAVEAVRAEAKADKVVLVGHSMGTPVIVQYARLFPAHVAGLVFVDGLVGMTVAAGAPPLGDRMAGPEGRQAREQMIRGMFSGSTTLALQTKILNMMMAPPEATAAGAMNATFDPAVWKQDTLGMPILALYADHSGLANRDYMKVHFPAMEYHEIAGTGHFLMLEKPEEFNGLLVSFLHKTNY